MSGATVHVSIDLGSGELRSWPVTPTEEELLEGLLTGLRLESPTGAILRLLLAAGELDRVDDLYRGRDFADELWGRLRCLGVQQVRRVPHLAE